MHLSIGGYGSVGQKGVSTPTTPDNKGGFALSGGGNSPHRIRAKEILNRWPQMIGKYQPRKQAAAVVFVQMAGDE